MQHSKVKLKGKRKDRSTLNTHLFV